MLFKHVHLYVPPVRVQTLYYIVYVIHINISSNIYIYRYCGIFIGLVFETRRRGAR
jgi:hypothetical protein